MGDLKKNKFDNVVDELNDKEAEEQLKEKESKKTRRGRKPAEARKVLPTYIPMSLYEEFEQINAAYGLSNNAAIVSMIRDYVTQKRDILNNI